MYHKKGRGLRWAQDQAAQGKTGIDRLVARARVREAAKDTGAVRRQAETEAEEWAATALRTLQNLDPDRAELLNHVGFSKADTGIGHLMAEAICGGLGLTDRAWGLARKICAKYHRQVGRSPQCR